MRRHICDRANLRLIINTNPLFFTACCGHACMPASPQADKYNDYGFALVNRDVQYALRPLTVMSDHKQ